MPVHITPEFLADLKESRDARFVRQVLNHVLSPDGSFTPDRDDHRYDGIADAWIRYVSRGATAYRVIFIRRGQDVFLYRAGGHSVEDHLQPPATLAGAIPIAPLRFAAPRAAEQEPTYQFFLKTTEARLISKHLQAMFHVRHREVCLVSPYIDLEMLDSAQPFGRFLDRAVEEDTMVVLVTSSDQATERVAAFKRLEERGMNVFFLNRLHTKMYLFDVDIDSRNRWQEGVQSHVIIGSSNLTYAGLGFRDVTPNEELNYRLSAESFGEARTYITRLTMLADDFRKFEFNRLRNRA